MRRRNRVGCISPAFIHPSPPLPGGPLPSNLSSRPERSAGEGPAVYVDVEAEPGGDSPTALSLCPKAKLQVPPLRCPGLPIELGGVGELHAAFRTESCTRG